MIRKLLFSLPLLLSGCGVLHQSTSIGQLRMDKSLLSDEPLPVVSHEDVREEYRTLLTIVDDEALRRQIERRIASVYMLEGDHNLLQGTLPPEAGYYPEAIRSYNEVIGKYPADPDNAESMYQLAKAYDLDGKDAQALEILDRYIDRFPASARLDEVYFRKGDIHFHHGQYENAEAAFQAVITTGRQSPYLNNSYYLLGWSRYKQSNYEGGLAAFSEMLDRLIPEDGDIERLDKVARSLVDDTLHVVSLSLSYDGGAEMIDRFYADRPQSRKYQWLLYAGLGEHFLEKQRYEDSAASYRAFVLQNPTSDRAPEMHSSMIRAYVDGEFHSQVLPEKERYVQLYGVDSEFWKTNGGDARNRVVDNLKSYLDELARHYHGTGQKLAKELEAADGDKAAKISAQADNSFLKAAEYYLQYMQTFPQDPRVPEMIYMRAEALFDGGNHAAAIEGYEKTAYELKNSKYGADAGYAALIAYQKHVETLQKEFGEESPQLTEWRSKSVDSQLRFVNTYKDDARSGTVLAKTAEELFALKRYEKALEVASTVIAGGGNTDRELFRTAYGVIAHSQYELGDYAAAEAGYREQLKYIPDGDSEHAVVVERMAAAAYKQGDTALQTGDLDLAVNHFLRIKKIAPDSDARVAAQYDAATHMMSMGKWREALAELRELREKFPGHELTVDVPRKIAYAYEQDRQWRNAAEAYMSLYRGSDSSETRRDALFIAAEMYEKAGEDDLAIEYFKSWAHAYEEPFDNRMEARYHLAYLYKKNDDMTRHLYWLRRITDGDSTGGNQRTDRSRWLAAWANAEYGDYWRWEFDRVKLRNPLQKWIPRKNEKLENALERYKQAAEYGIFDISARASYSIGELYRQFARELMDSPRPAGLSANELQQYELLLEEQAIPFEELAMDIHQANIQHAWEGNYNEWIARSFESMAQLSPARYMKQELMVSYGNGIR